MYGSGAVVGAGAVVPAVLAVTGVDARFSVVVLVVGAAFVLGGVGLLRVAHRSR